MQILKDVNRDLKREFNTTFQDAQELVNGKKRMVEKANKIKIVKATKENIQQKLKETSVERYIVILITDICLFLSHNTLG